MASMRLEANRDVVGRYSDLFRDRTFSGIPRGRTLHSDLLDVQRLTGFGAIVHLAALSG